jgi:hypothetical protein
MGPSAPAKTVALESFLIGRQALGPRGVDRRARLRAVEIDHVAARRTRRDGPREHRAYRPTLRGGPWRAFFCCSRVRVPSRSALAGSGGRIPRPVRSCPSSSRAAATRAPCRAPWPAAAWSQKRQCWVAVRLSHEQFGCRVGGRRRGLRRCRLAWFPPAATSNRACGSPAHGSPTFFTIGIRSAPPAPVGSGRDNDSGEGDQAEAV